MKNNTIKHLKFTHSKRMSRLYKNFFNDKTTGLILFVEYLKYLANCMTYSQTKNMTDEYTKTSISSIFIAIAEFEAYSSSITKTQKVFHWNNFCELIKLNMEEWLDFNDSI